MDWKIFATIFGTVFPAELGDETQLAAVPFPAGEPASRWTVFAVSASLWAIAGIGFVLIGAWTLTSGPAG